MRPPMSHRRAAAGRLLACAIACGSIGAAVHVDDRGAFLRIAEVDGGETVRLHHLRKDDVRAVRYTRTGLTTGTLRLTLDSRRITDVDAGAARIEIAVGADDDGATLADRIVAILNVRAQAPDPAPPGRRPVAGAPRR